MSIATVSFIFLFAGGSGWANLVSRKRMGSSRLLCSLYAELFCVTKLYIPAIY